MRDKNAESLRKSRFLPDENGNGDNGDNGDMLRDMCRKHTIKEMENNMCIFGKCVL